MEIESHSRLSVIPALPLTDAAGAATVGAIIDTNDYESLEFVITSGTITTGTFTAILDDGDVANLSDSAAVVDDNLLGKDPAQATGVAVAFAVTDDDETYRFGYIGKKRYVRMSLLGASTPVGEFVGHAILGNPRNAPVADANGA